MKKHLLAAASLAGTFAVGAPPLRDIDEAMIFTMQEMTTSDHGLDLARAAGSEVLVRGWFKWHQAPRFSDWRHIPEKAHAMGALFGGGITCSALYDGENGLTREQLLDLATRGPDGQLVDAWGQPGIRHGSLSSPAYLDYLFRWCREQIDAGADYLFMDEINAALGPTEGFDDYALADFRRFLLDVCPRTAAWSDDDARWWSELKIDLANPAVCPGGTMAGFDYRGFLRANDLLANPHQDRNALDPLWWNFRAWRDDRAWKALTDRIRTHARERGRTVLLSGNGLAKYVDLQVLGVWGQWTTSEGRVDLRGSQIPYWHAHVQRGGMLAGRRVPVVLFHDWGFGNPPFPFQAVPPSDRILWMRTRGAEIFAAGARFAFPVLGPFGCDAKRDGTLDAIAKLTAFYRTHRELFTGVDYLGCGAPRSDTPELSLAVSARPRSRELLLHVINRKVVNHALQTRERVAVRLPLSRLPVKTVVVSPDFPEPRGAATRIVDGMLEVEIDRLEAQVVVSLRFDVDPDLHALRDPARTAAEARWSRPVRNAFRVRPDGLVEDAEDLNAYLQGRLHQHLRNPPTFLVHAGTDGLLQVHVRAVSSAGAKLEYRVDGATKQAVDLPDLDGRNDGDAAEYDRTFTFPIPSGQHRLTLDNTGADWATIPWIAFEGTFRPVE